MAVIIGTGLREKFDLLGRYIWNGSSWVLTSSSGTTAAADTVSAGDGNDEVNGGGGNDTLTGGGGDDLLIGGTGNDNITGGDGNDTIYGGLAGLNSTNSGADKLRGGGGLDTIYGGDGNDDIDGGDGDDLLFGEAGNDEIDGGDGNDLLSGDAGKDKINGGNGNDTLTGGADADRLDGGAGGDVFVYNAVSDSRAAANFRFSDATGDVIKQFSSAAETANPTLRDKFDLSGLVSSIGHSLTWGDKTAGAYKVWYEVSGKNTFVSVDTSGDGKADLVLKIESKETLSATDFVGLGATDTTAPIVASAAYGANDGTLKAGETIVLTVTFSEAVIVAGGTPTLTLTGGGVATYTGGTGTGTLTFSYTVAAGQNTGDLAISALNLNTATIKDAAGNNANLSAAASNPTGVVIVDTSAPAALGVTLTTDSGNSSGDKVTNNGALTLSGVEGGALVQYSTDGGTTWTSSFTPSEGANTVKVRQTDTAGNVSAATTFTFTLDTQAAAPDVALTTDSGSSSGDKVTNTGALTLSSVEGGALVQYSTDGGTTWTSSFSAAEGANTVKVRQTDAAGNVSAPTDFSFTLDTQAPAAPGVALTTDSGSSAGDKVTNTGALTLSGVEGGALVQYSIDGGTTWTTSFSAAEGANSVQVRQTDAAGNVSAGTSFTFTLDTQAAAPGVALTTDSGSSSGDKVTNNGALTLSGVEGGALVQYSTDGGTTWTSSFTATEGANSVQVRQTDAAGNVSAGTSFTFTLDTQAATPGVALTTDSGTAGDKVSNTGTLTLSGIEGGALVQYSTDGGTTWTSSFAATEGENTVKVRQTDAAGNVSAGTNFTFTLDTQAAAPDVSLAADSGTSGDNITNDGTLALSGVEDGALVEYSTDGGATWTSFFAATEGENTIKVRQTDAAGNVSTATNFTFTLDTQATAPDVSLVADSGSSGDNITNNGALTLGGVESGALVEYSTDGGTTWISSFTPSEGENTLKVRQTDTAGNVSAATDFTFTLDTQTPAAPGVALMSDTGTVGDNVTTNVTLTLSGVEDGALVQYSTDGGTTWTTSFDATVGSNTVQVRQTDAAGNTSPATTFTFTFDNEAPAALGVALATNSGNPSDHVSNNGALTFTGLEAGATVEYSTDNGETYSTSFTPTEGENSIFVRQVDGAGNASDRTSLYFLLDTQNPDAPVITGYSDDTGTPGDGTTSDTTLTLTGTSEPYTTVTIYDNGSPIGTASADEDGAWTFDTAELDLAAHNFTATAKDIAGNVSDASAPVPITVVEALTGAAIDGYIAGATVFADANGNGQLDEGEASTTTDASGNYTLEGGSGALVLQGGTDISTGQSFTGTLRAPEGAKTITPLTTLVVAVAEANGISQAAAQAAVIDALGLDPALGNLADYDPIAAALSGDPAVAAIGAAAAAAAITIQNTILQGSALLAGAGANLAAADAAMLAALASQISVGGPAVDLTNTGTLTQIVTDAATQATPGALAPQTIQDSVTVIGAVNNVVSEAATTSSGANLLTNLAQVQIVVQTEITSSLSQAGQNNDASGTVNDFTGPALQTAVDDAAGQVGDVDGGDIGTAGDDTLTGAAGADVIDGKAGHDTISGEGGNDTLVGGLGNDTLTGGAGVDTYVWRQGDGYDTILSTGSGASEDVIRIEGSFYDFDWNYDGNDLIVGVVADDNYDFATTGGNLRLKDFSLPGNDSIAYLETDVGDNNAYYSPGGGNAKIYVNLLTGADQGNHFELILGTSGDDVMTDSGGTGTNRFDGGNGNDTITVAAGTFGILVGGNGNDTLTGANLSDELRGGAGNDTIDGGGGTDTVRYDRPSGSAQFTSGAFVNLSGQAATFDFNGAPTTVTAGSAIDNWGDSDTLANVENVRGSNFDDVLIGTAGANTLRGNDGNDILVAGGNDGTDFDFLYGGAGADSYVFGTETGETHIEDFQLGTDMLRFQGDVSIASLEEQDWGAPWGMTTVVTLTTGATVALVGVSGISDAAQLLAPPIAGTAGSETVTGTVFNDTIDGGQGDDTLTGGAGVDTYVWRQGDGYDTLQSTGNNGAQDIVRIEGSFYDYNWALDGDDLIIGVTADDNYDFNDVGGGLTIENFLSGNDSIAYLEADLGDNNGGYSPGGGNARVYFSALTGTDQGNHFELIIGTSGNDVMTDSAGTGTNRLWGGDGDDQISVTGVAGLLIGGNGNDTLTGGEFDDELRGSAGDDAIDGGDGIDIVRYDRPSGSPAFSSGAFVNLSGQSATFDFNGTPTTVAAGSAIDNWGDSDTLANIENVRGSNFDDVIIGTAGANTLRGNGGNDILVAGGNNGTDFDFLYGGAGADSYVFGTETGETHIEDFQLGTDMLRFQGDVSIASLEEQDWGAPWGLTTVVTLTTGATIALVGVSGISDAAQLLVAPITGTSGSETVTGTVFNDTIDGGQGDDTLTGGAGVDTYVWRQGDGYDTLQSTGNNGAQDIVRIEGSFYDYNWALDGDDLIVGVTADDNYDFTDVGGSLRIENFLSGNDSIAYLEADLGDNNGGYSPGGGNARVYFSALTGTDQGNHFELIIGTAGNDVMTDSGGTGANRFNGGDGDDTITVAAGTFGILVGGNGNDTLTGAELNDELRGAAGDDTIDGGDGMDTVRYDRPSGSSAFSSGAFVNLSGQAATFDFNGTPTTVAAGSAIDNWGDSDILANVENVRGSNFDDVLIGTSGANTLRGNGGNDILVAGGNDGTDFDFLYGGAGADSYVFGTETGETHIEDFQLGTDMLRFQGDVSIASLEEQDWGAPWGLTTMVTLTTGATVALVGVSGVSDAAQLLAPPITGTAGSEIVTGTVFNDTIDGGQGDDTLTGGGGVDTYVWRQGDGYDTLQSTGNNGAQDIVRIEGSFYDYNWALDGNDLIVGVTADDNYDFTDVGGSLRIENFLSGNDSIAYLEADLGDNNGGYSPGGGNARVYFSALTGTDQGNHFELIIGTAGNDVMTDSGGTGANRFNGGDGDDTITVAAGTFGVLVGGNGNDTLTGAELNDELRGAAGDDTINGGDGTDTVRYDRPSGSPAFSSGAFVNLSGQAATFDFNGTPTTVAAGSAIDNWGDSDILANVENVRGSNFDDVLIGTSGANTLRGNGGNDILVAGGNDGTDLDFLYGGGGADSYVFGTETGETHIEDFQLGTDMLRFQGDVSIASLEEQDWGAPWGLTTMVTLTTGATVVLVGVSGVSDAAQLLAPPITGTSGSETVTGTVFNDTIDGGQGDDTLTGGAGVDTYVWRQGDGYDTLQSTGNNGAQDIVRIEGSFYDYNWSLDGDDLIIGVTVDDNYDFNDVGGSLRIENFLSGNDSIAYLEADLGPDNNGFYSPGGGNARVYFSALTGTDQGNHFELIIGTSGNDVMTDSGGTGANRFNGGDGDDTITVAAGSFGILIGGNGNDTLTGAELNDELRGSAGDDTIDGGDGVDIVRYDRPSGSPAFSSGAFVNLSGQAATFDFNGTPTTVAAGSAIDNWGDNDTLANIENVRGSNFDDVLIGTSGANTLRGNGGNDILMGGADNDWFSGGGGADTFVFATEAGDDWIDDFQLGSDSLQFQGMVGIDTFADIDSDNDSVNDSTLLTLTSGATVTLHGVTGITDPGDLIA